MLKLFNVLLSKMYKIFLAIYDTQNILNKYALLLAITTYCIGRFSTKRYSAVIYEVSLKFKNTVKKHVIITFHFINLKYYILSNHTFLVRQRLILMIVEAI